ncbi:unnamed protein product [Meloidogyne enterolobii]|uniref:Uncharacterized protein n=1 Tax=Meloidogyne enterolobii TaxID=390850 RepID=A0ACB0ZU91_MELEN
MFYYFSIFNIFILVFIKRYDAQFTLSRTPGSKPLHLRIQLPPTSSDSISFIALFPNENCLTNNLIDNRYGDLSDKFFLNSFKEFFSIFMDVV